MDFKNPRRSQGFLKSTKILMVRSLSCLENGPFINMGITGLFYIPYFKPIIDFNMLHYTSSSDSQVSNPLQVSNHFNDLLAGLLVDFNDLIILERSKHTMHAKDSSDPEIQDKFFRHSHLQNI